MKFRDEKGNVLVDIERARQVYCAGRSCLTCAVSTDNMPEQEGPCGEWCDKNVAEAAFLMGYEIISDDATDTNVGSNARNPYWAAIDAMARKQRAKGISKYGQGLEDNPLSIVERIAYLQEELIDGLMYCEHIKAYLAKKEEGKTMLNELAKEIHENAVAHGWWDEPRTFGEIVALCHSELSEALEEYRAGRPMVWKACLANESLCQGQGCEHWRDEECKIGATCGKPEGIAVEMADCIIRVLDWCGKEGIDIDAIIQEKHKYNKTRSYRHGGKVL